MNRNKFIMVRSQLHLALSRSAQCFMWLIRVGYIPMLCVHVHCVNEVKWFEPLVISSNERQKGRKKKRSCGSWQKLSEFCTLYEQRSREESCKRKRGTATPSQVRAVTTFDGISVCPSWWCLSCRVFIQWSLVSFQWNLVQFFLVFVFTYFWLKGFSMRVCVCVSVFSPFIRSFHFRCAHTQIPFHLSSF